MFNHSDDVECKTVDCQMRRLDRAVKVMLSGDEPDNFPSILLAINRHLYQLKLQKVKTVAEVFIETYFRAVKKIEAGEPIANVQAWFRLTAFCVVREWSCQDICEPEPDPVDPAIACTLQSHLDVIAVVARFERLTPNEQKLLQLRAMGLTWEEVAERLIQDGVETARENLPQRLEKWASLIRSKMRQEPGSLN
jgi:DNA-directed RNA polymerase specialized sigma24 family protein